MRKTFTIIQLLLAITLFHVKLNCQQKLPYSFDKLQSLKKTQPDSVVHIIKNGTLKESKNVNSDDWSMLLGQSYYYSDQHDKAYHIFDSLQHSFNAKQYHKQQLYQSLANTSLFLGKYNLSEEYAHTSIRLSKERQDTSAIYDALISSGNAQYYNGSTHLAIKKYLEALAIVPDSSKAGNVFVNLGGLIIESGQYDKGIEYTKNGLNALGDNPAERDLKVVLNNLATAYYKLDKIDSSTLYLEQYAGYENNSVYNQFFIHLLSGNISIKRNEYTKAKQHLVSALHASRELEDRHSEALVHGSYAWFYSKIGEEHKSASAFELSKSILDSLGSTLDLIELEEQRLNSNLSSKSLSHFKSYQSLLSSKSYEEIEQIISSYQREIRLSEKQDSLQKALINQRLKSNENTIYRYGLLLSLALLCLMGTLLYIFSKRTNQLKSKNQELNEEKFVLKEEKMVLTEENQALIFQKKELEAINDSIQKNHAKPEPVPSEVFIDIVLNNKPIKLNTANINYVCAEDNGCRFYLSNRSEWSYVRLKEIKDKLPDNQFAQIHRSHVVRVDDILSINHNSLTMKDGQVLNIGRSYKDKVLDLFE